MSLMSFVTIVCGLTSVAVVASSSAMNVADTCSLNAVEGDVCGQSDIDCKYVKYAKLAEKSLQDGTCASQGYTVKGSTTTRTYPVVGSVTVTQYTKSSVSEVADMCSLYAVQGDVCGQSDIDCKYAKYAKLAEKSLQDGTCASQGYTVKGSTTTRTYPVVGSVTVTQYTKPSVSEVADTCSLYAVQGDVCGQSDIDCKYVKYAKLAEKSLLDGTCASQGYAVKGSTTTRTYPVVGSVTVTQYTKSSVSEVADTCSLYAVQGDVCGQSDIDCKYVKYAKLAEKKLQDGTCASQGYTVKGSTTTRTYPVVGSVTVTQYTKSSVSEVADTCSLYAVQGDVCGQSDIDCKYVKYAKLAEKSLQDGTCASQGYTIKGSTTTRTYPVVGSVTVTQYSKSTVSEVADACSLYAVQGDVCGQSDIDCKYVKYAKLAEKSLQDGTCASQGYTVKGSTTTRTYPVVGSVTVTQYTKATVFEVADTCSLYAVQGDVCGQSDIDCKYVKYAKLAEKSLKDGTCASQGYTVKGSTTTKTYPVVGAVTVTEYTKSSVSEVAESCSLYAVQGDVCGQSDIDCKYVKYAKLAERSLQDGTCASQGYTVKGSTTTRTYPIVGSVTVAQYTKPSVSEVADTCSLYAVQGDVCGQSDIDCKYVKYAKLAEKSLQDGTCASQGYTVKGSTTTRTYPVVGSVTVTQYTKSTVSEVSDTCSLYAVQDDVCGQSDIDCKYVKYAKLAEKSLKDGTCASQGYTVKGSTTTKTYPVVGAVTVTQYTKSSISEVAEVCSLYAVQGDVCGQSDIDCKYVKYAKLAEKSLQDGTCTSKGYTVKGSTTTSTYPVVGAVTITKYTKPSFSILV